MPTKTKRRKARPTFCFAAKEKLFAARTRFHMRQKNNTKQEETRCFLGPPPARATPTKTEGGKPGQRFNRQGQNILLACCR